MSKQYGLILPGQRDRPAAAASAGNIKKASIFAESSSDSDSSSGSAPQVKSKNAVLAEPSAMEKRMARRMQEKALAEDPTVFQYDELYDDMEAKREDQRQSKTAEPKKPKYIGRLMETAERRKLEYERRVERQVQKEREQEGEEFKDKESFVTAAYREKLEELRKQEEQEKRDDYLEAIGDVTKQKDIDGFYRHLYEQKTGSAKEVKKPEAPSSSTNDVNNEISYKPIKSSKSQQQRAYRKRHSSDDNEEDEQETRNNKKVHLSNNIDADSDFSIDSDSSAESEDSTKNATDSKPKKDTKNINVGNSRKTAPESAVRKVPTEEVKNSNGHHSQIETDEPPIVAKKGPTVESVHIDAPKPKQEKIDIWKKRTVGEVLDNALQRYYERKAARNA